VHLQQILNAYGSSVVFHWLNQPSKAARVVTIHELDAHQIEFPERNRIYNKADGIIVHCQEMKRALVDLKVRADRIHVVLHGAEIQLPEQHNHRDGIIFYGGHKLMTGKGLETLFEAMSILKQRLGPGSPELRIHGHYSDEVPEEAKQLALRLGIADKLVWLNQLTMDEIVQQYRSCILLVLPYTGSFAGLPVAIAAANGLPVVCTKKAGIPDHLGECGVWIDEGNAGQLAERVMELLGSEQLRREVSLKLRKRAKEFLGWDVIADRTLEVYESALKNRVDSPSQ
jgi:glycosyltransferase involved in cell wall biosynthesis